MKNIYLLALLVFSFGCSRVGGQDNLEVKQSLKNKVPPNIVVGNCYLLNGDVFKLTTKGDFSVGLYQEEIKNFATYPLVDFNSLAKEVTCPENIDKKISSFLKKYEKNPFIEESKSVFSPGQCIHFKSSNVLVVAVSEKDYFYLRPQLYPKSKLHEVPYQKISKLEAEKIAVRTDCFLNLAKDHEKFIKNHTVKN